MNLFLALLTAYIVGAIPAAYLMGRWGRGIDLREHGSKNLGATNVYRVLGWRYAIPVAVFDISKGAAAVLVVGPWAGGGEWTALIIGTMAIIGHVFSIFVKFRGGKGVATAAGVMAALAPIPVLISFMVWGTVVYTTGYVSLGSILGALAFPLSAIWIESTPSILAGIVLSGFILFTHRSNIRRLREGTESRFGQRAGSVR